MFDFIEPTQSDIEAFKQALIAKLPQGIAFDKSPNSNISKIIESFAIMFSRVQTQSLVELDELIPSTTTKYLDLWEIFLDIDPACFVNDGSIEARRKAIIAVINSYANNFTREAFETSAKALGYEILIESTKMCESQFGSCANSAISGQGVPLTINGNNELVDNFENGESGFNFVLIVHILSVDPSPGGKLECFMNRNKPVGYQFFFTDNGFPSHPGRFTYDVNGLQTGFLDERLNDPTILSEVKGIYI